jgi:hypothetical protein
VALAERAQQVAPELQILGVEVEAVVIMALATLTVVPVVLEL